MGSSYETSGASSGLDDLGVRGVAANRVDAVQGGGLRGVALADRYDLAVAGLEAEPVLAGLVGVQLERACHETSFLCRVEGSTPSGITVSRSTGPGLEVHTVMVVLKLKQSMFVK